MSNIKILLLLPFILALSPVQKESSVFELMNCLNHGRKDIEENSRSQCFVGENGANIHVLGNKAVMRVFYESNIPKILIITFIQKDVRLRDKVEAKLFREKFQELELLLKSLMKDKSVFSVEKESREYLPENCISSDNRKIESRIWQYSGRVFRLFMACISEDFVKKEIGGLTLQLRIEKP